MIEYRDIDTTKEIWAVYANEGERLNHLARRVFVEIGNTGLYRIYVNIVNQWLARQTQNNVENITVRYFHCEELNTALLVMGIQYKNYRTVWQYFTFGDYIYPEDVSRDALCRFTYGDENNERYHVKYVPSLDLYTMHYSDYCWIFKNGMVIELTSIGEDE